MAFLLLPLPPSCSPSVLFVFSSSSALFKNPSYNYTFMYTGHVFPISSAGSAVRGSWRDCIRQQHPGYPLHCSRVLPQDTKPVQQADSDTHTHTYQPRQGGMDRGDCFCAVKSDLGVHKWMNLTVLCKGIWKREKTPSPAMALNSKGAFLNMH